MTEPYGIHNLINDGKRADYSVPLADLGRLAEELLNKPYPHDPSLTCRNVEVIGEDNQAKGNMLVRAYYHKGR